MSINLSDMNFTGGIAMSPQIFSGSLLQENIGWQYLSINPASTQFDLVGDFTIEAWVCPTSSSGLAVIDARASGGSAAPWLLWIVNNGSGPQILFFDGSYHYGTNIVPVNAWSHVAIVRVGSTLTFYLNGEVDASAAYTSDPISPGSTSPVIGSKDGGNPWYGYVSNLRVVVGVAVYTSAFTPSTSPLTAVQPANLNGYPSNAISGNQTVLLLNTDYNGFNFLDRSHNNFTLLNDNMPVPNSYSPFFPASSISFDGYSYLLVPSLPTIGTNQFTIEGWVKITSASGAYGGNYNPIISWSSGGGGFRFFVGVDGTWSVWDSSSIILSPTSPSPGFGVGQWTHFVIQRDSSNLLAVYVNGVLQNSTTATDNWNGITGSGAWIGGDEYSSDYRLWGNISNLRYVLGQSVYTTDFTPSNHPLSSTQDADVNGNPSAAITGTATNLLLTTPYNINYLLDSSSYNRTVTPVGSPSVAGSDTGSSYFYNTNFNIAATEYGSLFDQDGAFTIECYYYPTEPSYYGYAQLWTINAQFWDCVYDSSPSGDTAGKFIFTCPYIGNIVTTDTFTTYNTWYHIALSSDGTTIRAFINGTLQGTFTGTGVVQTSGNPLVIGYAANGPFGYPVIGNISNFRMVKGVAVYTSAFTPSTNPLTAVQAANVNGSPSAKITGDQTVLLLNTPNNILNHLDSSSYQLITTTPNTPVPAAWNPYNLGSISFNGSSSLQISNSTLFNFDVNDFTIETWAYWSTAKTSNETIFEGSGGARLIFGITDTGVRLYTSDGSTGTENGCTYAFSIDAWYHIAVVRLSGNISIYINGVLANTPFADSIVWVFTTETIGGNSDSAEPYTGEISNLRVVNGVAIYTDTFTVPIQPLTVSQIAGTNINSAVPEQTVLLLNTPDSPNNTLDSSIYHLTVTPGGSPAAIVNNPFGPL